MEMGMYHRMSPQRLHPYFAECAWRENHRCDTPMQKPDEALGRVARLDACRLFKYQNHLSRQAGPRRIALRPVGELKAIHVAGLAALLDLGKAFEQARNGVASWRRRHRTAVERDDLQVHAAGSTVTGVHDERRRVAASRASCSGPLTFASERLPA
jgi:hypothetical protein